MYTKTAHYSLFLKVGYYNNIKLVELKMVI